MRFSWRALAQCHQRCARSDASDKMLTPSLNSHRPARAPPPSPPIKSMRACHHWTQTLYYHRLGKVHVKQGVVVGVIAAIPAVPAAFIAQQGASAPSSNKSASRACLELSGHKWNRVMRGPADQLASHLCAPRSPPGPAARASEPQRLRAGRTERRIRFGVRRIVVRPQNKNTSPYFIGMGAVQIALLP